MPIKPLLFLFFLAAMAECNTLTVVSGDGQVVPANTGQHGNPIVFQVTNGSSPVPGAVISLASAPGTFGFPLTTSAVTTDSNGMASVGFAPGVVSGSFELFALNATTAGAPVVTFHETVAMFPPASTALLAPPEPALLPYTASSQVGGTPITVAITSGAGLQYVAISIEPVPVAGSNPPPGTLMQSASCLVNGVLVPQVLTDATGKATCVPVFSEPNAALNFQYNSGQFKILIGGSFYYGPFPYNILASPPTITGGPKNLEVAVGTAVNASISVSGGTAPFTFTLAEGSPPLPGGVTLQTNGQLAGVPTTPGIFPFTVQVTDSLGKIASSTSLGLSFAISGGAFAVTPAAFTEAVVGLPFTQTVTLTGGVPPYKLSTGGALPPGLMPTFGTGPTSNTFTIAGTPSATGTFSFFVVGLDALNTAFQVQLPIQVGKPLTVPGAMLPPAPVNTPYSFQLTPTGGVGPYTFTSANLPAGLALSTSGVLSGTPTTVGLNDFSITVMDAYKESVMSALILPVSGGTLLLASPAVLPAASAATPYTQQLAPPTGGVPPYTFTLSGAPAGVTLTTLGFLAATFPTVGTQSVNYTVTDAIHQIASGVLQIQVVIPTPVVSAITNAASSATGAVSPGEIVTLYGTGIGPASGSAAPVSAGVFPTTASNVQVLFGTFPAALLYVSATQINAVVPFEVVPGTSVPVTLTYNGNSAASVTTAVQTEAPGIFLIGKTQGAILNDDYSVNSGTNAAAVGSFVQIYSTGSGPLVPAFTDGELALGPSTTGAADVSVTIGGIAAQVLYAGSAPGLVAGALQINVVVPTGVTPGPAVPVVLTIGTQTTASEMVTLGIK